MLVFGFFVGFTDMVMCKEIFAIGTANIRLRHDDRRIISCVISLALIDIFTFINIFLIEVVDAVWPRHSLVLFASESGFLYIYL